MIIHNFYMFVWYLLWAYVLFCVIVKLYIDQHKQKKLQKDKKIIKEFFLHYLEKPEKQDGMYILKLAQDDLLFDYICKCYLKFYQKYSTKRKLKIKSYMRNLFRDKINSLAEDDVQMRCLILSYLYKMDIRSTEIDQFVSACGASANLERIWSDAICSRTNIVTIESRVG